MNSTPNCPRCFAPLRAHESPGGLCPKCLLSVAMGDSAVIHTAAGVPAAPPPTLAELAPHFPQLELQELIGRGGMGAVYKAVQQGLDRPVALKVLTVDHEGDPAFAERFVREARAMASLAHPNIATVYDSGRAGPWYYLVLELVDGPNLRQVMRAGDLRPTEALSIVTQICAALEYAHGEGVVHRDIKPENVLLDRRGRVKIVDFGLAKLLHRGRLDATLTRSDQAMGTLHYMAPEQVRRPLEVDHRADIYSLGVVFYELLTGDLPMGRFQAPSQRAQTDVRLDEVVFRTLEQDPERRYQSVKTVREDVEHISSTDAPRASLEEDLEEVEKWAQDLADDLAGKDGVGVVYSADVGSKKGVGVLVGCLLAVGLVFGAIVLFVLLAMPTRLRHEPAMSSVEEGWTSVGPGSATAAVRPARSGVDRLLELLPREERRTARMRSLARSAWSDYRELELRAARAVSVTGEPGEFRVEIAPFPDELDALQDAFRVRAGQQWDIRSRSDLHEALRGSSVFPSGRGTRVIAVQRTDRGLEYSTSDGFDGWCSEAAALPVEVAVVHGLLPNVLTEVALTESAPDWPWPLARVGLDGPHVRPSDIEFLAELTRDYRALEERHTTHGLAFAGGFPELRYELEAFPAERARLAARLQDAGLAERGLDVSESALLPFGDAPRVVSVRWEASGERVRCEPASSASGAELLERFGGERAIDALAGLPFVPAGWAPAAGSAPDSRDARARLAAFQLYAAAEAGAMQAVPLEDSGGFWIEVRGLGPARRGIEARLARLGVALTPSLAAALTVTDSADLAVVPTDGGYEVALRTPADGAWPEAAPVQELTGIHARLWSLAQAQEH